MTTPEDATIRKLDSDVVKRMAQANSDYQTIDYRRLMPNADEQGDPGDMESDFAKLRMLSRDKKDSMLSGFKSYMGVETDSTPKPKTTDEQWIKCLKRQYDVKRNATDREWCAQKERDEGPVYDNFIKCRQSTAGNEGVQDIVTIPANLKQSANPGKKKLFKEEYDRVLTGLENNENFTSECWGRSDYEDREKLSQLGGKKRRRRRSTKKRKGAKKRKGTKKRRPTKKRKGAKKRKGTKKRKPTKKCRRGTRKARK